MADGKEYVSRPDELGNIHISCLLYTSDAADEL